MSVTNAVGARVKQLREGRGWTQATLAKKAGVSRVTIGRVEIGYSRPSDALLRRLAKLLGTTSENLKGGTMHEVKAMIEVAPDTFMSIQKVARDEALAMGAVNTALLRVEALAEELALEISSMKALGARNPEIIVMEKIRSALAGKRFKTPYMAMATLRERDEHPLPPVSPVLSASATS